MTLSVERGQVEALATSARSVPNGSRPQRLSSRSICLRGARCDFIACVTSCGWRSAALSRKAASDVALLMNFRSLRVMQAALAILGIRAADLGHRWRSRLPLGARRLLAVGPFTVVVVAPTNSRLLALEAEGKVGGAHGLLTRWNRLHAVRTALGLRSFVLMLLSTAVQRNAQTRMAGRPGTVSRPGKKWKKFRYW